MIGAFARWIAHAVIFAGTFAIEVRVKAAEQPVGPDPQATLSQSHSTANAKGKIEAAAQLKLAEDLLQEPRDCLRHAGACAFHTGKNERYELRTHGASVRVDYDTAVVRNPDNTLILVSGTVWVQSDGAFSVQTEFGQARVSKGEMWVHNRPEDRMTVSATIGDVSILPNGTKLELVVEPGFENFARGVQASGVGETGLPVAMDYREHVARLARLYPGTRSDFENDVKAFHIVWQMASERSAVIHQQLFERKVASLDQAKAERAEIQRRKDADSKYYRDLMRQRLENQ